MFALTLLEVEFLMSQAFNALTAVACIAAAQAELDADFLAVTSQQQAFLKLAKPYFSNYRQLSAYVQAFVGPNAGVINAKLKEAGFDIELQPFEPATPSFGVVGISDVRLAWHNPAKSGHIERNGTQYPAFRVAREQRCVVSLSTLLDDYVVVIQTSSNLEVRIAMAPAPDGPLALMEATMALSQTDLVEDSRFAGAVIPCVNLDIKPNVSWMQGMITESNWAIAQAVQQVVLGLDRFGAHAKSATAMEIQLRGISVQPPMHVIDRPFLITITRQGVPVPLFGAYVTQEHWSLPSNTQD